MDFLQELGYRRFSSPAMNTFDRRFADLDAYVDALRSRYRQCVRKSLDKSRAAGLRYERLTDTDAILRLYTPSLHRLYEAVAMSSANRLELLPPSFFPSLARHLPGLVGLTLVYAGDRIAAFNWNLFHDGIYHFLFAGLDYDLNPSLDLYFNLMYAEMDQAFRAAPRRSLSARRRMTSSRDWDAPRNGDFFTSPRWASSRNLILQAAGDSCFRSRRTHRPTMCS